MPQENAKAAKRKSAQNSAAEGTARLEAVLASVVDGIITIDEKGKIESFNPGAARIFGYEPSEVIGKNVKILMPEPYHGEHDGYLKNFLDTGEAKIIGIGREIQGLRKDGTEFPAELAVSEMNVKGRRSFVGIIRDITERKEAERIIAQQHQNLLELSTPVLKVWDQVVLLPLIGRIDEDRAAQIIENLLEAIVRTEARVAVIDVTGVPEIDTFFAGHLMRTVAATKMLGAEVLVTGVSPAIAQTLIRLGADLSTITACGPLKEGIARALGLLGITPGKIVDESNEDRSVSS